MVSTKGVGFGVQACPFSFAYRYALSPPSHTLYCTVGRVLAQRIRDNM